MRWTYCHAHFPDGRTEAQLSAAKLLLVNQYCLPPPGPAPVTCAHIKNFIAEVTLWKALSLGWLCHAHRAPEVEGSATPYPGLSSQMFT